MESPLPVEPRLTVVYSGEADEVFEFPSDGCRRTFGRDDERCDIVIWSAINAVHLARVAGVIFRMDGELWIRNVAESHALQLWVPGRPPEPELPPRRSAGERGAARSIPGPVCWIVGPDGCELLVRQDAARTPDLREKGRASVAGASGPSAPTTSAVPPVPEHLRPVAVAVCAPLLRGSRFPATYSEVAATLRLRSPRSARRLVEALCEHYPTSSKPLVECAQPPELVVPGVGRVLSLPVYYDVAHLLVNHHRVDARDLGLLPPLEPPT